MDIKILGPDEFYYQRALVNDAYVLSLYYTVLGQTRVQFSYKDDAFSVEASWCCGFSTLLMCTAVNCMLGYIEQNKIRIMPSASDIKPFYKDQDFLKVVMPFFTGHYTLRTFTETFLIPLLEIPQPKI